MSAAAARARRRAACACGAAAAPAPAAAQQTPRTLPRAGRAPEPLTPPPGSYISMYQLIAEEFSREDLVVKGRLRAGMFAALLVGAAAMCIVGIWA